MFSNQFGLLHIYDMAIAGTFEVIYAGSGWVDAPLIAFVLKNTKSAF
ncbi:MAG: hypothetical protein RM338_05645 [Nostoc sp. DedQUE12a]|nr:hypothetical protein [Nostoc sp. DedQUE12a]